MTLIEAMSDDRLFAPWFRKGDWSAWRAFLSGLFGLPMSDQERHLFAACTDGGEPPTAPVSEAWLICGRRSGKSFVLALIAVFLACFVNYAPFLAPGERGVVMVIASDRRQARVIMGYVRGFLTRVPMLRKLVAKDSAESIDLRNSISIEVTTASMSAVRGYTIVAALCDEVAFWPTDDAADADYEVLRALRPGSITIPNALLLCASSPYARKGALYDAWVKHFGKDNPRVLVWQAPTLTMHPDLPRDEIDAAMADDPSAAKAEWLAQFRDDIEDFVSREAVLACVEPGRHGLAPSTSERYFAFVDPSGGSSDSMTLAIGHRTNDDFVVVDALDEVRAPFDPEDAVEQFAQLLRHYNIRAVTGDAYAGKWCASAFEKRRIDYLRSEAPKSALYLDLLPRLNARTIRLVDHPRMINQICALERRTARGGRDSIDHKPGRANHDDLANAVAGLCATATAKSRGEVSWGAIEGLVH